MKVTIGLRHLYVVYVLALCFRQSYCFDYCKLNCQTYTGETFKHTMCLYKSTKPGPRCTGYDKKNSVMSQLVKNEILKTTNKYRSNVAMGKETRGSHGRQPSAANMMEMVWNKEMEAMAQRYALQCTFEHDTCRTAENGDYVGQNMGLKAGQRYADDYLFFTRGFYDEVKDFDKSAVDSFRVFDNVLVGHYTQMVWAESNKMGCAIARYEHPKYNLASYGQTEIMVCNYQPGGNMLGAPIYRKGAPCSKCPKGARCSKRYPGLCTFGDIGRGVEDDEQGTGEEEPKWEDDDGHGTPDAQPQEAASTNKTKTPAEIAKNPPSPRLRSHESVCNQALSHRPERFALMCVLFKLL